MSLFASFARDLLIARVKIGSFLFFIVVSSWVSAQQIIHLNDESLRLRSAQNVVQELIVDDYFGRAEQTREFRFNPQLRSLTGNDAENVLLFDFFDDKQYHGIIQSVTHYSNGTTGITAKIAESDYSYCYLSVSGSDIAIRLDLFETQESFMTFRKGSKTYISCYKTAVLRAKEGRCESVLPPLTAEPLPAEQFAAELQVQSEEETPPVQALVDAGKERLPDALSACGAIGLDAPVTIDVLIPYTAKAKEWASTHGGIDNIISLAFQTANTVMQNSKTHITFNLAYAFETTYDDTDSGTALDRLHSLSDGFMDEVHTYRKEKNADLVVLFMNNTDSGTGGLAYLLTHEYGFPRNAFAIAKITQASGTTMVHEIGHIMGCSHHKLQGGEGTYSYSYGWRGTNESGKFSTIMTYDSFDGQGKFPSIDYFSDPTITIDGASIGDANEGNNALTLRRTKLLTSLYSDVLNTSFTDISVSKGTLSPAFNPEVTAYRVEVGYTDSVVSVVGLANYNCAAVSGNKTDTIVNVGENTFTLSAQSHDGAIKTAQYKVVVSRQAPVMTAIRLSSGTLSPAFDPNVTSYVVDLPNEVSSISITGIASHSQAFVSGNQTDAPLNIGENVFTLSLYDKTYQITVIRKSGTCSSYTSRPSFAGDISAAAGDPALHLNLSQAVPIRYRDNRLPIEMPALLSPIYLKESAESMNCHYLGSDYYKVYLGTDQFKVTQSGDYTFTSDRELVVTLFRTEKPSCEGFVNSSAYWAGSGASTYTRKSFTASLESNTTYYISSIEYRHSNEPASKSSQITITGPGDCYTESAIPYGIGYTYIAANKSANDRVEAQSETGDFSRLAAGEYTIYGVSYSKSGSANETGFVGKTNSQIASSECETLSDNFINMTISEVVQVDAALPDISKQPVGATYTQNEVAAALRVEATVSDHGTLSYQWYSNTSDSNSGGVSLGSDHGAQTNRYTPASSTIGTTYYYVVVTNTNASVNGTQTADVVSDVVAIEVRENTQAQLDREAAEAVKVIIESAVYHIAQATGNTKAAIHAWLADTLHTLCAPLADVQIRSAETTIVGDVTVYSFVPAIAGAEASTVGTNGSFTFTVTLTCGETTLTTTIMPGVIVATPYVMTPVRRIELSLLNELGVHIRNTGNVATGDLTLSLSGTASSAFMLPATTIGSLAVGDETDVTLTPRSDLADGTYHATFMAQGENMEAASIDFSYSVNNTGNEHSQQQTITACIRNGKLHISGLTEGASWSVYTLSGTLVCRNTAAGSEAHVPLAARGIYIVTSGDKVVKVVY